MSRFGMFCSVLLALAVPVSVEADEDAGAPFGMLPLVDEVVTGNPADPHTLFEDPVGGSKVATVLGQSARTMAMDTGAKIFGYKLGAGKGLVAGQAYVLVVEYPEEAGRQLVVVNRGAEQVRTFATGQTIGDARESYTYPAPESLHYPLSGKWESIRSFFYLHEHFQGVKAARDSSAIVMDGTPADGFWVLIGQFRKKDSPFDAGAAVGRIRLFAVPDPTKLDVAVHFPPSDLPRRHVSWREEMADGIIGSSDPTKRAFANSADWYDAKMKLARFLGVNTFTKDLLEFGFNQNWDTTPGGGATWWYAGPEPMLWEQILNLAAKHNMDVLPYYEYAGAKGAGSGSTKSYGYARHCRPLGDRTNNAFSDVGWSEDACIDVSDPAALDDVKKLLDATILRFKTTVPFVGAWFRTRNSNWPISFADETLARFGATNGTTPTRAQLQTDSVLLGKYYTWWFGQRRAYLIAIRDYLRQNGLADSAVLFTSYVEEALHVPTIADWATPTDDMTAVTAVNTSDPWKWRFPPTDWMPYVTAQKYTEMIQRMTPMTPAELAAHAAENDHSAPPADPKNYTDVDDVYMAMPFSRQFTVSSAAQFDQFRAKSGLAIVRHFTLNEEDGQNAAASEGPMSKKLGYFITDVDRAGPYSMLAEARAVAYGDPRFVNYLSSSDFSRGFPEYTRAFNAAYLALPALPSTVVANGATDAEVVVREIKTSNHGSYYAVVNVGMSPKTDIKLTLPASGQVYDLSTGNILDRGAGLAFYPGQLYALQVSDTPIGLDDPATNMPDMPNMPKSPGGCACNVGPTASPDLLTIFGAVLVMLRLRRRR